MFAEHTNEQDLQAALACCRGDYQRNIVLGHEAMSGSTLRGLAKKYGYHYQTSREALLTRMRKAGVPFTIETRGRMHKRVLVIGRKQEEEAQNVA
jgi:hypothetical protein